MTLTSHYHFMLDELEMLRKDLYGALNRGSSKKRPGTGLSHAQSVQLQKVFTIHKAKIETQLVLEHTLRDMQNVDD